MKMNPILLIFTLSTLFDYSLSFSAPGRTPVPVSSPIRPIASAAGVLAPKKKIFMLAQRHSFWTSTNYPSGPIYTPISARRASQLSTALQSSGWTESYYSISSLDYAAPLLSPGDQFLLVIESETNEPWLHSSSLDGPFQPLLNLNPQLQAPYPGSTLDPPGVPEPTYWNTVTSYLGDFWIGAQRVAFSLSSIQAKGINVIVIDRTSNGRELFDQFEGLVRSNTNYCYIGERGSLATSIFNSEDADWKNPSLAPLIQRGRTVESVRKLLAQKYRDEFHNSLQELDAAPYSRGCRSLRELRETAAQLFQFFDTRSEFRKSLRTHFLTDPAQYSPWAVRNEANFAYVYPTYWSQYRIASQYSAPNIQPLGQVGLFQNTLTWLKRRQAQLSMSQTLWSATDRLVNAAQVYAQALLALECQVVGSASWACANSMTPRAGAPRTPRVRTLGLPDIELVRDGVVARCICNSYEIETFLERQSPQYCDNYYKRLIAKADAAQHLFREVSCKTFPADLTTYINYWYPELNPALQAVATARTSLNAAMQNFNTELARQENNCTDTACQSLSF